MTENFNDVSAAFDGWLQTVIGTRAIAGAFDANGRWSSAGTTPLSFPGVVQNATPDDMLSLEEGQRTTEAIKIHTTFELIPQDDDQTGDIITYRSKTWLVKNVAHRYIGGYHKALAVKQ